METENTQADSIIERDDIQEAETCHDCGEDLIDCQCQQGGH